ncbi:MAG: rhamnan synthesis F family protein [Verrucomicrobiota bacterium]
MKIAIYAHFSSCDRIVTHAWPFLKELLKLDFKLIFVSNSAVCDADLNILKSLGVEIILRGNCGLDFGMWNAALKTINVSEVEELLLTNSSIIGPLAPLGPIFEQAKVWQCDFWGITDSTELAPHLQSYFIVLRKNVIESLAFERFWSSMMPYHSKSQIIRSYEIGLTIWLEEQGFRWRALISQESVWKICAQKRSMLKTGLDRILKRKWFLENTTLSYPELVLEMGSPFFKSSLLVSGSRTVTAEKASKVLEAAKAKANLRL